MGNEKQGECLHVVVDRTGRQYIGKCIRNDGDTLTIEKPFTITERLVQATQHNGQQKIDFGMSPLFHTFDADNLVIKWVTYSKITDGKIISIYKDAVQQVRISRSGLHQAKSLPSNVA